MPQVFVAISRNGAVTNNASLHSRANVSHRPFRVAPAHAKIIPAISSRLCWTRNIAPQLAAGARDDAQADDAHLISTQELSDGTLIFSFGTEEEAKAVQEDAPSAVPAPSKRKDASKANVKQKSKFQAEVELPIMDDPAERLARLAEDIDRVDGQIVQNTVKAGSKGTARKEPKAQKSSPRKKQSKTAEAAEGSAAASKATKKKGKSKAAPVKAAAKAAPAEGDLDALKVPELRALAKEHGLKGYSKMRKAEIIELITANAIVKA